MHLFGLALLWDRAALRRGFEFKVCSMESRRRNTESLENDAKCFTSHESQMGSTYTYHLFPFHRSYLRALVYTYAPSYQCRMLSLLSPSFRLLFTLSLSSFFATTIKGRVLLADTACRSLNPHWLIPRPKALLPTCWVHHHVGGQLSREIGSAVPGTRRVVNGARVSSVARSCSRGSVRKTVACSLSVTLI